jgi:hypothetical protein
MLNPPKTIEEAKEYKYNQLVEYPGGILYEEGFCAYEVLSVYQCSRKNGYGPAGLYCKQHVKMVE